MSKLKRINLRVSTRTGNRIFYVGYIISEDDVFMTVETHYKDTPVRVIKINKLEVLTVEDVE